MSQDNATWLCRNCNTLLSIDIKSCPKCGADQPEECSTHDTNEVVEMTDYANATETKKNKYIFRESVLIYAADITLILGIFLTFGALLLPNFTTINYNNPTLLSIVIAVATFATAIVSWAILRTLAEMSMMLRKNDKKE